MKFSTASSLLILAGAVMDTASAFVVSMSSIISSSSRLNLVSDRVEDAIQAAQEASSKYGPTSPEARVAWDTVEELEASDNSVAYKSFDRPADYEKKVEILKNLMKKYTPDDHSRQEKALEVKPVKFGRGGKSSLSTKQATTTIAPEILKTALAWAREMSEKYGNTSPEAAEAWDEVEEISAAIAHSSQNIPDLMKECWVELSEACDALEEVDRVFHLKHSRMLWHHT